MAVHQCERFFNNTRLVNKHTIRNITNYLASMTTYMYLPDGNRHLSAQDIIYKNSKEKRIGCYIDDDFAIG